MKVIRILDLPDDIYQAFEQLCAQNHRSMQDQARFLFEREVLLAVGPGSDVVKQWRDRLASRVLGDTVHDVRAGRSQR